MTNLIKTELQFTIQRIVTELGLSNFKYSFLLPISLITVVFCSCKIQFKKKYSLPHF